MESFYQFLGRSSVVLLFIFSSNIHAQTFQNEYYYIPTRVAGGTPEICTLPEIKANSLLEAAQQSVADNNEVTTMQCNQFCRSPVTLHSINEENLTYTIRSNCSGRLYTHPIQFIQNAPKNQKDKCDTDTTANPCQVSTGAKFRHESDFKGALSFIRNYHSLNLIDNGLGKGWHNSYFKSLAISGDNLSIGSGSGRGEPWRKVNDVWVGDVDSDYLVAETPTGGFIVTDKRSNVDEYDSDGRLLSKTTVQGQTQSYAYDAQNRLITVTSHNGLSLNFAYSTDGKNHIIQVTDNNGTSYHYEYDSNDNLVAVIYPDTTADNNDNPRRIYHYENVDFPNHLTGITDATGTRYATFAYDANGKAVLSELATTTNSVGQERIQLSY